MPAPESPRVPRSRSDVVFRQLDDEWVLFDPRTDQLHVLNLSAAVVWAHCDGATDIDGIAGALVEAFSNLPLAQARQDVDTALAGFREAGLLE